MKKYAIYSRLLWLMAILSCPTVIAGQDSGPRLDTYSRKFPFRFRIGDDSEKGNGELTLIAQYKSEAGGSGRLALKNDTAQFDFKGAKVFLLEIYLRDVNIKKGRKRNLQLKFDNTSSQGKFQPVSSLPYIVELNRFKSNTTDYKLVFKILQNGEPTLVLPIQILDEESGETLGHLNAEIRVKVKGIPIPAPPDQSLCKACGNYNYDSCFLLIKKHPGSPCLSDALSKINSYDEILWAKCKGSDASQKRDRYCLTQYLIYFEKRQYIGKYDSLARAWLNEKITVPDVPVEKPPKVDVPPPPPREPLSLLEQKQPDGSRLIKIMNATSPRYKDISWDEGLEASWSADSSALHIRYPRGGGIYGIMVQDGDVGRRDSLMFEDDATVVRLEMDASKQQYTLHISQGQSPYRIDFVDSLGVVFSVKKNDNSPYKFSVEDLIAAGLVGQVTIRTHDADDITDQVVPTKINLPTPPDHSFWYFLVIAIFSILFLLLFLLFWRRRKNKKRMTGYAYP